MHRRDRIFMFTIAIVNAVFPTLFCLTAGGEERVEVASLDGGSSPGFKFFF